jgi:hypothetical protein
MSLDVASIISGSDNASILAGRLKSASDLSDLRTGLTGYGMTTYTDAQKGLNSVSQNRDMQLFYAGASKYLESANTNLEQSMIPNKEAEKSRNDTYTRQFEINEWTAANRQETLFVFQLIFFGILLITILGGFWRMGVVSGTFVSLTTTIVVVALVFVIVYRTQYTNIKRDKRYWNRRRFESAGPLLNLPNCPAVTDFASSATDTLSSLDTKGNALLNRLANASVTVNF